jgi:hypothetical protein
MFPARILAVALSLVAAPAWGYTVGTPVTGACHEMITETALRGARAATPAAAPMPLVTEDDQAMAADLPFPIDGDMGDLGAISLLFGVRDNDLEGLSPTDLAGLAIVQSNAATQDKHCLRSLGDLEPAGTRDALAACRAYILGRVAAALVFLTPSGAPDPDARVGLAVSLAVRGEVVAPLPGFYVDMGQALHALQDGFSHSYRAPGGGPVTEVLDWLHLVDGDLDETTDGPPHSAELDECTSLDALRAARLSQAEEASQRLLLAALGPGDADTRLANATRVLDEALAYQSGCTAANGWCHAPERAYGTELGGCSAHPGARGGAGAGGAAIVAVMALGLARRRRRRAACVGVLLAATSARAAAGEAEGEIPLCTTPPPPAPASRIGAYVALGGAFDHTAMNASLGARLWLTPGWLVGVDAEINPWLSILGGGARPGALNVYATVVRRWPLAMGAFSLRSTAHVGSSTILFDLFGVPRYTTGVYLGANLLGVEWKATRSLSLVLDPADVAFPVPQLAGTPFGYLQYRLTVGLQWGA